MKFGYHDWWYPFTLDSYQNSVLITLSLKLLVFLDVQRAAEPDVPANENIGSVSPSSNSQLPATAVAPSTLTMADYASTLASLRMVSVLFFLSMLFSFGFPMIWFFWWICQISSFMCIWEPMDLNKWSKLQALLLVFERSSALSRLCKISGFVFASCSV